MADELKPCPICGNRVVIKEIINGYGWRVGCIKWDCLLNVDQVAGTNETEDEAIKAWNRRTP